MAIGDGPIGDDCLDATKPSPFPSGRNYPYLVQAGATLKIKNVEVKLDGPITGTGPKIRGTQADGFDVPATTLSLVSGDLYEANNIEVTNAFPSSLTAFYDTFDIDWEVSLDGSTWEYVGTSNNPIYVSLADPISNTETMFRTVVHGAISNAGATDSPSAVAKTWALFSTGSGPANYQSWDRKPLYYYQPGYNFDENLDNRVTPLAASLAGLLRIHRGQCAAWALLLKSIWAVNGVNSTYVTATCLGGAEYFLVKTWDPSKLTNAHPLWFQSPIFDMIPVPAGGAFSYYDDPAKPPADPHFFLNTNQVKGQGTEGTGNCPSEKVFQNHQFLCYGGTYYDPSYGVTYTGEADFQLHLDGWATTNSTIGSPYYKLNFHVFTTTLVHFDATC